MGRNNFERYFSFFNFWLGTYNVPSGSSAISLTRRPKAGRARSASLMGRMGRMGRVGRSPKVSFTFLQTLWVFRTSIYIYIYTCIRNKKCHQHSYGFQNLMSSWGRVKTILEVNKCTWVFRFLVSKVFSFLFFFAFNHLMFKIWKTFSNSKLKKVCFQTCHLFVCFELNNDVNWEWNM